MTTMQDLQEATADLLNKIRVAQIKWAQERAAAGKISPENLIEACANFAAMRALSNAFPIPEHLSEESAKLVEQFANEIKLTTGPDVPPETTVSA